MLVIVMDCWLSKSRGIAKYVKRYRGALPVVGFDIYETGPDIWEMRDVLMAEYVFTANTVTPHARPLAKWVIPENVIRMGRPHY